ncbi:MAG: PhoH family protein [Planctomycetota bacterium]
MTKPTISTEPPATPAGPTSVTQTKYFVLDTNVLLHNPAALHMFDDNQVIIPFTVLEELDKFKKNNDDTGRNCREVIRQLDRLRSRGPLAQGVAWNGHGGTVRIDFATEDRPSALREDAPDNRIIAVAWRMQQEGKRSVMISKDINVRIKSDSLGVPAEDFEAQKVDSDRLYKGYAELDVPGTLIDLLYEEKQISFETMQEQMVSAPEDPARADGSSAHDGPDATPGGDPEASPRNPHHSIPGDIPGGTTGGRSGGDGVDGVLPNQFVHLRNLLDESHSGLARRLGDTEYLIPVHAPRKPVFGVMARNAQQTMALDLLLDDDLKLVTLLGTAGTGKTLLALAAGMAKVFTEHRYDKLLVARPIMPMGRDIGYLPGDKDEKLAAWMQPIFDNLEYLLSTRGVGQQVADSKPIEQRMKQFMSSGQLVMEPLTYIRGRSIPNQFMIVDEAQNLTPHEVKTIVSRVGEGTKIILTGDVAQIDNPYLDASSNGMSYLIERLKGSPQVGHVTLAKSERSELASLAAEKL